MGLAVGVVRTAKPCLRPLGFEGLEDPSGSSMKLLFR